MPAAIPIPPDSPEPADPGAARSLRRLRWLAWLLDGAIPVGPWRIGLDPLVGLIPGFGDWLGALASGYIVYEAARLGIPGPILLRMVGNILVETLIGIVPVLGDACDFAWKVNLRNLALIDRHYRDGLSARPAGKMGTVVGLFLLTVLVVFVGLLVLLVKLVSLLFH